MSKAKHKLIRRLGTWAVIIVVANTLGALGYTPAAGCRYAWRKLDRAVTGALASVP